MTAGADVNVQDDDGLTPLMATNFDNLVTVPKAKVGERNTSLPWDEDARGGAGRSFRPGFRFVLGFEVS